jgi:gamma-glutamylaminecyclotransferase
MTASSELRVFVYGTLMRGEAHHALLARQEFLGPALTEPIFELIDLGPYPALVPDGHTAVCGELYRVDRDLLPALDELEGHPGYYRRISIFTADGREAIAYVLESGRVGGRPRIPSGDWRRRANSGPGG